MMNRKLAHGRHLEWGRDASERWNPQGASDGESVQRRQRSESREPRAPRLPDSNESIVSVVRHTIEGIWPDTVSAVA